MKTIAGRRGISAQAHAAAFDVKSFPWNTLGPNSFVLNTLAGQNWHTILQCVSNQYFTSRNQIFFKYPSAIPKTKRRRLKSRLQCRYQLRTVSLSMAKHQSLLEEFENYARTANTTASLMQHVSDRLHHEMGRYNWVGFYLMEAPDFKTLVVGPYAGSFQPTPRIRLDEGLCGAAASTARSVVVNDVSKDLRYLGSDMVKSNMVSPIFVNKRVMAEICIESYFTETFTAPEQTFVESCAKLVGRFMEKHP
jgi:L-methionine (R)-S-oxide reductase